MTAAGQADPTAARRGHFAPFVIAPDLAHAGGEAIAPDKAQDVIIEINLDYQGGRTSAKRRIESLLQAVQVVEIGHPGLRPQGFRP